MPRRKRPPTLLLVDDSDARASRLADALRAAGWCVERAAGACGAEEALSTSTPDLLVLRAALSDGPAHELLEVLQRAPPVPPTIVLGAPPSVDAAFRLGAIGVRALLEDDAPARVVEAARRGLLTATDPAPLIRGCVGLVGLPALERRARAVMIDEALRRAQGSRHEAARLLHVSRQMLQQWLRRSATGRPAGPELE